MTTTIDGQATRTQPDGAGVERPSDAPERRAARATAAAVAPGGTQERLGAITLVLLWVSAIVVILLVKDGSRGWMAEHLFLVLLLGAGLCLMAVVALLQVWAKPKSEAIRAAVYLLVTCPVVALGTVGMVWMPTAGQLITLRAVALAVLVFTPAVMWWLFIATQRASLLNEFIANLDRLGLLDVDGTGHESHNARETRISSYLQKFEATYGRLPDSVCHDVVRQQFRQYSSRDVRENTSNLTAAAVPVTLAVVTLLIGWILVLPPINDFPADPTTRPRWLLALSPNATPVTFAFLGAYFFSMQMLFRRYVRGDLRGSAYVAVVLRVVLAVVGIWVLQGIGDQLGWMDPSLLLVLAFVVGVFPSVVWQLVRSFAARKFDQVLPTLQSGLPLSELDGLTAWHQSRLEEEDIENVHNMATADVVDLLVNTRIPPTRLIDWIDQAILLTQVGARENDDDTCVRQRLRCHGVRSASALLARARTLTPQQARRDPLVPPDDSVLLPSLVSTLATSDNLTLVMRWHGLEPLTSAPAPELH